LSNLKCDFVELSLNVDHAKRRALSEELSIKLVRRGGGLDDIARLNRRGEGGGSPVKEAVEIVPEARKQAVLGDRLARARSESHLQKQ